jgi:hypothetical protein
MMTALATKKRLKTFHATMQVTRLEEWCVEADTADEAKQLLASGIGHRCHLGECLQADLHQMLEE